MYSSDKNILKKIRERFPWKYLLIVRYSSFATEDYFFKDYIELENFIHNEFDSEYVDFVVYLLEPHVYDLRRND